MAAVGPQRSVGCHLVNLRQQVACCNPAGNQQATQPLVGVAWGVATLPGVLNASKEALIAEERQLLQHVAALLQEVPSMSLSMSLYMSLCR